MAKRLKFNWKALYNDLTTRLIAVTDELINEIYREITSKLSEKGRMDSEKEEAKLHPIKKTIEASCVFYANAILDSYGVGMGADTSSESFWNVYQQMKGEEFDNLFNDARTGVPIVGRPVGAYTNIFGENEYSTGSREGQILYGLNKSLSRLPTYAIQYVEAWLMVDGQTKIERAITTEIDKFFQEGTSKYFTEVGK